MVVARSKCSVLGYIHRNKFKQPKREVVKSIKEPMIVIPKALPSKVYELAGEKIFAEHKPGLMELGVNECRYVIGDPKTSYHFCGIDKGSNANYCSQHHALCYIGSGK